MRELPVGIVDREGRPDVRCDAIAPEWLGAHAVVLHGTFTRDECQRAIDYFESCGVETKCHTRTDYRNNYRVVAVSEAVAAVIYERILPLLPEVEVVNNDTASYYINNAIGMHGRWTPSYLNPCFRLCKYDPDGHFAPHFDSDYVVNPDLRSLKTFMIYLNDDYEGGETNFLESHALHFDKAANRYKAPAEAVRAGLKAAVGDALVFDHNILHEGATVRRGFKYIMRCEVMYAREPVDFATLTDEERAAKDKMDRALTFLRQAQQLEAERRELEAVEFYRKAFKLAPELDRM